MPDHSSTFLLITLLFLATIVLIAGMKYFSAGRSARLIGAGNDDHKALADDIREIKTRLGAIEKILREVE